MKILVTGGMGFIGSHLVDALVKDGHSVKVFDSLEEQVHHGENPAYLNKQAEYIIGDVADRDKLKKAVRNIEVIFHEAAQVGVGQSMYQVSKYIRDNTFGTAVLLDILVNEKHKVKKLMVASSMSIYGEGSYECAKCGRLDLRVRPESQLKLFKWEVVCPNCNGKTTPVPTKEDKLILPTSIYAMSKLHQEETCLLIGKTYRLPTVALRYFNVYGTRQSLSNPYTGVCAIFSSRIKNNHRPIIYEDGLQSRDFIHVSDIVAANMLVMKETLADYQAFNVGTGIPISILEIARILARLNGKNIEPEIVKKYRSGDIRHCFADISAIEKIGFKPNVAFEQGMKNLVDWSKSEKALDFVEAANKELEARGLTSK